MVDWRIDLIFVALDVLAVREYARWYLRHPSFDDRVLQVTVARADDPAIYAQGETVIQTLALFAPVSGSHTLIPRADAIRPASSINGSDTLSSVEAKLMLVRDLATARGSAAGQADLDTPVWLILRTGDFAYRGVYPLAKPGQSQVPFPHSRWEYTITDARNGALYEGASGIEGSGPGWWAALVDRSR